MVVGLTTALMLGGVGVGMTQMIPPVARDMQQSMNLMWTNELLGLNEVISLYTRGIIDNDAMRNELKRMGLSGKKITWLTLMTNQLLPVMELINLERRGKIDREEVISKARDQGWAAPTIENLYQVTESLPSASDVIAFAVREVYSPEIAEAFGQYEGVEAVLAQAADDIKATGMDADTFKKFWAAHWRLPGVEQGYEMLQRDVIDADTYDKLMVALDIMPYWRDKLKAIAYHPYTRVDVRRMHKLGILSDDQLLRSYMDLGYDQEKARGMADFTVVYNADPPEAEQTDKEIEQRKERDLTKADVINGYRDGLLSDGEVTAALTDLGYDKREIEYYKARIDYEKETEETDSQLKYYHDTYIHNILSYNDIVVKMGDLNLPSKRIERLFVIWDLEKLARTNKPTKAELMAFLRKNIITRPTFIDEMKGLAYPDRYINWYLETI